MKRFLYFLLALLGFAVTSCEPEVMYGTPEDEYNDKKEEVENAEHTNSNNSTDRVEPHSADEESYE